jgi:hypothetical protein
VVAGLDVVDGLEPQPAVNNDVPATILTNEIYQALFISTPLCGFQFSTPDSGSSIANGQP